MSTKIGIADLSQASQILAACPAEHLGDEIDFEDHTASMDPLEAYESAWEGLRSGKQFNVLLSVNSELEDL